MHLDVKYDSICLCEFSWVLLSNQGINHMDHEEICSIPRDLGMLSVPMPSVSAASPPPRSWDSGSRLETVLSPYAAEESVAGLLKVCIVYIHLLQLYWEYWSWKKGWYYVCTWHCFTNKNTWAIGRIQLVTSGFCLDYKSMIFERRPPRLATVLTGIKMYWI